MIIKYVIVFNIILMTYQDKFIIKSNKNYHNGIQFYS